MKKLLPQTADAECIGVLAGAMLKSINLEDFQQILDKYHFTTIQPDKWYSHGLLLDILREVRDSKNASYNMVSIGMKTVDEDGPRIAASLSEVLFALPALYERMHRGVSSSYSVEKVSEQCVRVKDLTPWPHDMVFGMLWQIAKLYDFSAIVNRTATEFDEERGDEIGIYEISWEKSQ